MQWSPDGATIYFTSTRVAEPYVDELGDELYAVPAGGGAIAKVAAIEGGIGNISVSPDGKRIAFVGDAARQADPLLQPARSVRRGYRVYRSGSDPGLT